MTKLNRPTPGSWEESVLLGFEGNEDAALHLDVLYVRVKMIREAAGFPLSATFKATIRRTLQESSLFAQGTPRSGLWGLTPAASTLLKAR